MSVLENNRIELSVMYEPKEDSKVTWYRNNQPLQPNEEYQMFFHDGISSIIVQNANKTNVGRYEVVVENNNVVAKSASSIKLLKSVEESEIMPPVFIRPIRPTRVRLGDIVMLEAEVVSVPCASMQWFIGTTELATHAKQNKLQNICVTNKENVSCLCIENITKEYLGVVTCRAENVAGSVSCSASLLGTEERPRSLVEAPNVLEPLSPTVVMDGEPVVLSCVISGWPVPKVDWYHNERLIQKARDITVARLESGLSEICIREAFPEMSGVYRCVATNELGSCATECVVEVEGSKLHYYSCFKLFCMQLEFAWMTRTALLWKLHVIKFFLFHNSDEMLILPCICRSSAV